MVEGVTNGYSKTLEIVGVGYKAAKSGKTLTLNLGHSHPIVFEEKDGITFDVPNSTTVVVNGIDKQTVGQIAAQIREKRPPEPYLGKGHKGQNARSGGGVRPGFEGGQIPLYRRLPKRGFKNAFAKHYAIVNVNALDAFEDGAVVNAEALLEKRIIRKTLDGVKILGRGEITKKVTVQAAIFSASAKEKIESAGGKCEVV